MKRAAVKATSWVMLLFLGACAVPEVKTEAVPVPDAGRTQVVLMPDQDGKVGEVTVRNRGGSRKINQAGQMAEAKDGTSAISTQAPLAEGDIHKVFGAALAALPKKPVIFILYFKTDSTELTEASQTTLSSVHAAISDRQSQDISVIGHTDRTGEKSYNVALSRSRALKIKKFLISKSVNPSIIEVDYHGEADPLIKTPDGVAEPRNRRVEVTVR